MEGLIQLMEQKISGLISEDADTFLVEIRVKPTNNIKIFLDADNGISIDRLIRYNRKLYRQMEEESIFPDGDFSLEVSSPGLDEPLRLHRQYLKNIGRFVEVTGTDGSKKEGKLLSATESEIVVEEEKGKGKKKEVIEHHVPFDAIKSTLIQVKF